MYKSNFSQYPDSTNTIPVFQVIEDDQETTKSSRQNRELFIRKTIEIDPIAGFELLFLNYYEVLCSHAVRFIYNHEVAEDLVSEVFMNIWTTNLHCQIKTSFRAYLFTAVRNQCLNYLKGQYGKFEEIPSELISTGISPDHIIEFDELLNHIEKTVETLPPQCQKIFLMSRYEGLTHQDIGNKLQISTKAVEGQISKAIKILRKTLRNYLCFALVFFTNYLFSIIAF